MELEAAQNAAREQLEQFGAVLYEVLAEPASGCARVAAAIAPLAALAKAERWTGLHYLTGIIERGLSDPRRRQQALADDDLAILVGFSTEVGEYLDGQDNSAAMYAGLAASSWWPAVPADLRSLIQTRLAQAPWLKPQLEQTPSSVEQPPGTPEPPATPVSVPEVEPVSILQPATNTVDVVSAAAEPDAGTRQDSPGEHWVSPDETGLLAQALNEQLLPLAGQVASCPEFKDAAPLLVQLHDELALLGNAFEVMELPQLHAEIERVRTNLELLSADDTGWSPERATLVLDWALNAASWLGQPLDPELRNQFLDSVRNPWWLLEQLDPSALAAELEAIRIGVDPAVKAARKHEVAAVDMELKVAADVAPAVLEGMLRELPGNVAELGERLQRLARGGGAEDIDVAQRIAHTIKGDANIVGVSGIANLTHALEDILVELKKRPHVPAPALAQALLDAGDCVATMADHLLGHGPPPEDALDTYHLILFWANRALDGELEQAEAESPEAAVPAAMPRPEAAAEPAPAETTASDEPVPSMMVPVPLLNSLLQLSGEAIVMTRQFEQVLRGLNQQQRDFKGASNLFERLSAQLEDLVSLRGVALQSTRLAGERTVDPLELDQYDELHTVSRRIQEIGVDQRDHSIGSARALNQLTELLTQQDRLHAELQRQLLQTRKIAVSSIVPRLKRAVRQTARALLKDCELIVVGEQQEIDSDILGALVDPLMHAVRNAVDHGIEAPEERLASGKPAAGLIELRVRQDGAHVLVELRDDGRGLNLPRIRAKAEALELIAPDAELDDQEIARLILLPGFSTRDQTTQISGRGIGLDVVASQVRALKGSLNIDSTPGQGSRFQIRVPADLNTTQVLIAPTPFGRVAIATDRLERLVMLSPHELVQREVGTGIRYLGSILDASELAPLCFGGEWRVVPERASHVAMLYRTEQGRLRAVLTDQLTEARTIIVSRLGQYAPNIPGIRGATILGDGRVAPIIDLPELVQEVTQAAGGRKLDSAALSRKVRLPRALIADDSLSVRRALEQLLRDAGFEVDTARDGLEALGVLNRATPDVILLDLEMPKLSGLEVASFVRQTDQFKHVPVVMITSRTGEKHRQMASEAGVDLLLTKPYSDEYLLEYLQGRLAAASATQSAA